MITHVGCSCPSPFEHPQQPLMPPGPSDNSNCPPAALPSSHNLLWSRKRSNLNPRPNSTFPLKPTKLFLLCVWPPLFKQRETAPAQTCPHLTSLPSRQKLSSNNKQTLSIFNQLHGLKQWVPAPAACVEQPRGEPVVLQEPLSSFASLLWWEVK